MSTRERAVCVACGLALAMASVARAQTAISVVGVVESTSGGFKFPDGSVQASAAVAGSAPVQATGLDGSQCFDTAGVSRSCTGTGEDGEKQAGTALPTHRFADNGDGTVTDLLTSLIWLKDPNCPAATKTWQQALDWIGSSLNSGATACDGYSAGTFDDWRLPNVRELSSLVDYGQQGVPNGHPFGFVSQFYWSSSSFEADPSHAWVGDLRNGGPGPGLKTLQFFVWAVRGGE